MNVKISSRTPRKQERDPDLTNAEIAMRRAARKAREIARKAGVPVVFLRDGKIIMEEQDDSHAHPGH